MKKNSEPSVVDVYQRELGQLSTRNFANRFAASKDLVLRLEILRKLYKHERAVTGISFNEAGNILVSGSIDCRVILWGWETGHERLSFHSGHYPDGIQAKIMPFSDDSCILTCGADGQIRRAQIRECGKVETESLAATVVHARKLAVETGSPHSVYTCCGDGAVCHIDLRSGATQRLFTCKHVRGSRFYMTPIDLTAIATDPNNPNLFVVGGSDEFARLYDVRRYKCDASSEFDCRVDLYCCPHIIDRRRARVTGLAISDQSELIVSYRDEFIYLFDRDNGLGRDPTFTSGSSIVNMTHDCSSSSHRSDDIPKAYMGHRNRMPHQHINFLGPKCEYIMSGSDCGRAFIWKKSDRELIRVLEADEAVNCLEPHPRATILASCGRGGRRINIWVPKAVDRAILPEKIRKNSSASHYYIFDDYDDDDDDDNDDANDHDDEGEDDVSDDDTT